MGSSLPHKLLIALDLEKPSKYKKFLLENETVNGVTTGIHVEIKNVGKKPFSNGGLVKIQLERPTGVGGFIISVNPIKIKALEAGKKMSIDGKEALMASGLWIMRVEAKFKDKEKIEYYHVEGGVSSSDSWQKAFYVADRHQLELNILMDNLLKKKVQ